MLSGLSLSDNHESAYAIADRIVGQFQEVLGTNSVRMPVMRNASLSVSRVPYSHASIALMVTAPASSDFVVHLVGVNGKFIGSQRGHGEGLTEFGKNAPLAPGMYFAIVKSGSMQKTMKLVVQ